MLLSQKKEGRVFGLASGSQLAEFAPNSFQNHGLAVSADGRFIAVPSFTAEVKVDGLLCWGRGGGKGWGRQESRRYAVLGGGQAVGGVGDVESQGGLLCWG